VVLFFIHAHNDHNAVYRPKTRAPVAAACRQRHHSDPHTSSFSSIFKEIYLVGTHINRNP
jgi:hypothetical protein